MNRNYYYMNFTVFWDRLRRLRVQEWIRTRTTEYTRGSPYDLRLEKCKLPVAALKVETKQNHRFSRAKCKRSWHSCD